MTVLDLIIRLQQLPPNMEVMLDVTKQSGSMFHFTDIVSVDETTPSGHKEIVLITPYEFEGEQSDN